MKIPLLGTIAAMASLLLAVSPRALALSTANANTMMDAYNTAFYVVSGSTAHYANNTGGGTTYFWGQAEEIEMLEDAYERTGNTAYYNMIAPLLNGFTATNGTSWSGDSFNDDCMWATIAFVRGYLLTGNTTFRTIAKNNFDMVYTRGWDTVLGGGIYWTTAKQSKNSCVNGPAAIAAYFLSQALSDSTYLTKAQAIFAWQKSHLVDANGKVYDSENINGTFDTTPITYNEGTYIGAANLLGNNADAELVTAHTVNVTCAGNTMPQYGTGGDGGGFNGICLRWLARYVGDQGKQSTYLTFLQAQGDDAYNVRRTSDNLSWCQWGSTTPAGALASWDCTSSVVATQVGPAASISTGTYALISRKSGLAIDASGGATGNGTSLIQWGYSGSGAMKWTVTPVGGSQYNIIGVASGRAATVTGNSTANNAVIELYDYSGATDQLVTMNPVWEGYYTPVFVNSGKALTVLGASTSPGASIIQYTVSATSQNAQWQFKTP